MVPGKLLLRIKNFIEMEHRSCSMDAVSSVYIARSLMISEDDVRAALSDMGY